MAFDSAAISGDREALVGQFGLQEEGEPPDIDVDTTWSQNKTLTSNVHVKSGATLTITSNVTVAGSGFSLIVDNGGKLLSTSGANIFTTNVVVETGGRAEVSGARFANTLQLKANAASNFPVFTGNSFAVNAVRTDLSLTPLLVPNTFDTNSNVYLYGAAITSASTLAKLNNVAQYSFTDPYADINVNSGGVLAIEPGVTLVNSYQNDLYINNGGKLVATAIPGALVNFSLLVQVNNGGQIVSQGNRFNGGLFWTGNSAANVQSFVGNSIAANSVRIDANLVPQLLLNSLDANSTVYLYGSTITSALTLPKLVNVSQYSFADSYGDINVNGGGVWTLEPGATLVNSYQNDLYINNGGKLVATAIPGALVNFSLLVQVNNGGQIVSQGNRFAGGLFLTGNSAANVQSFVGNSIAANSVRIDANLVPQLLLNSLDANSTVYLYGSTITSALTLPKLVNVPQYGFADSYGDINVNGGGVWTIEPGVTLVNSYQNDLYINSGGKLVATAIPGALVNFSLSVVVYNGGQIVSQGNRFNGGLFLTGNSAANIQSFVGNSIATNSVRIDANLVPQLLLNSLDANSTVYLYGSTITSALTLPKLVNVPQYGFADSYGDINVNGGGVWTIEPGVTLVNSYQNDLYINSGGKLVATAIPGALVNFSLSVVVYNGGQIVSQGNRFNGGLFLTGNSAANVQSFVGNSIAANSVRIDANLVPQLLLNSLDANSTVYLYGSTITSALTLPKLVNVPQYGFADSYGDINVNGGGVWTIEPGVTLVNSYQNDLYINNGGKLVATAIPGALVNFSLLVQVNNGGQIVSQGNRFAGGLFLTGNSAANVQSFVGNSIAANSVRIDANLVPQLLLNSLDANSTVYLYGSTITSALTLPKLVNVPQYGFADSYGDINVNGGGVWTIEPGVTLVNSYQNDLYINSGGKLVATAIPGALVNFSLSVVVYNGGQIVSQGNRFNGGLFLTGNSAANIQSFVGNSIATNSVRIDANLVPQLLLNSLDANSTVYLYGSTITSALTLPKLVNVPQYGFADSYGDINVNGGGVWTIEPGVTLVNSYQNDLYINNGGKLVATAIPGALVNFSLSVVVYNGGQIVSQGNRFNGGLFLTGNSAANIQSFVGNSIATNSVRIDANLVPQLLLNSLDANSTVYLYGSTITSALTLPKLVNVPQYGFADSYGDINVNGGGVWTIEPGVTLVNSYQNDLYINSGGKLVATAIPGALVNFSLSVVVYNGGQIVSQGNRFNGGLFLTGNSAANIQSFVGNSIATNSVRIDANLVPQLLLNSLDANSTVYLYGSTITSALTLPKLVNVPQYGFADSYGDINVNGGGVWTIEPGVTLVNSYQNDLYINSGGKLVMSTIVLNGMSVIGNAATSQFTTSGTLTLNGSALTVQNGAQLPLGFSTIESSGTSSLSVSGATSSMSIGAVNNLRVVGGTLTMTGIAATFTGSMLLEGGNLNVQNSNLILNDSAVLKISSGRELQVAGSLTGSTTNADQYTPTGTVTFAGGTAAAPRTLEVLGKDLGAVAAGFNRNYAIGTLRLASSTYVKLLDNNDNATGSGAEAVYVDTLVIPTGSTLNLNGLKVYARVYQLDGTVLGGTVTQIPDAGPLTFGQPSSAKIANVGEIDEWSFFGIGGKAVTVIVNPGSTGTNAPIAPQLNWARVQLLDPSGAVLTTVSNTTAGAIITLSNVGLPISGLYRVKVSAEATHASNLGNYTITAWDLTPSVRTLNFNQTVTGSITTPFSIDQWNFAASKNTQVLFDLINSSNAGITYSLTGPNNYTAFSNTNVDSGLITLPADGQYSLTVRSLTGSMGNYAFNMRQTSVTDVALGSTYSGTFAGNGDTRLFRFQVPANQVVTLALNDAAASDRVELYAQFDTAPTRAIYEYRYTSPSNNQQIVIPSAIPGTWYVLVVGDSVQAGNAFTFKATGAVAKITEALPTRAGNAAPLYMTIAGAGFVTGTTVAIVNPSDGSLIAPTNFTIDSFRQLTATFPANLPAGSYALRVTNGSSVDTLAGAVQITVGGEAHLETQLIMPNSLGRHAVATLYVEYANTGDLAMPAPLLSLQSSDADNSDKPILTLDQDRIIQNFWSSGLPPGTSTSVLILGSGQQPGILNPGERIRVPVYFLGLLQPWNFSDTQVELEIRYWTEDDVSAMDWSARQEELSPPTLNTQQWSAVFSNLTSGLTTSGDYVRMLNENARYLGRLGENVGEVDDLWNFEVQQAYGFTAVSTLDSVVDAAMPSPGLGLQFSRNYSNSLYSRYQTGPLGRGWTAPWQVQLVSQDSGSLVQIVGQDGSARTFTRDTRNGSYFSGTGDSSRLVALGGGVFELQTVGGTTTRFLANGKVDYVRDTNNNRVTATYNGSGRLSQLTHSSSAWLSIAYNASGLIGSVTDSAGRATLYGYDATNNYLTSVTTPDGKVTQYTYQTTGSAQTLHALLSIARGGTTQFFTYDARGRLDTSYVSGNSQLVDYAYDTAGMVTVDDDVTKTGLNSLYFDHHGQLAKTVDALGNISTNEFDADLRLSKNIGPTGESQSYTWCSCGSMTSVTNELGQKTSFTYDTINGSFFKRMTSFTDAKGSVTRYRYDNNGNLLETIYPNGSVERLSNYAAGLPGGATNRRGQPLNYTYNSYGQVTKQTFADSTFITFAYDSRGNLTTVTDGPEVTTYSYALAVDGDRLKRVTYPNGRFLDYTYDSFGRRIAMVDQEGFATRYEYDSAGRLSRLGDAANVILVTYTYDSGNRLSRIDKGNGTFTTYEYDASGQILSLKNWRNATTLNSKFDYTYDVRGRRVSMTTLDGTWSYGYDATGQLTRAIFASLDTNKIVNQDLQYFYDAVGNRTKTIINGVETLYVTNNLNQYTSVGGVGQTYDADGNLTFDGVSTYTWNQQGLLVRMSGPAGVIEYEYDTLGKRIAKVQNGTRTEFVNSPTELSSLVAEYDATGLRQASYTYGMGLVGRIAAGQWKYFDFDGLGSTSGISDPNGSYVNRYSYGPFGEVLVSNATVFNGFEFGGRLGVSTDVEGISYMGARYYNVFDGRFTALDPIRLQGGEPNMYSYVGNAPLSLVDPFGMRGFSLDFWDRGAKTIEGWEKYNDVQDLGKGLFDFDCNAQFRQFFGMVYGSIAGSEFGFLTALGFVALGVASGPALLGGAIVGAGIGLGVSNTISNSDATLDFCGPNDRGRSRGTGGGGGGSRGSGGGAGTANSWDPNEKRAGAGYGTLSFVSSNAAIPYHIEFENYSTATAPAQNVTISDYLSGNFDWTSFRLTEVGYGDTRIAIPAGSQNFQTTRSMTHNGKTFNVIIELGLRVATGEVFAIFQSLDPNSELPPDVLTGFLPPEDGTGRGIGYFNYTVKPKANLSTGTEIRNVALISFDDQLFIATDQVDPHDPTLGVDPNKQARITIDAVAPTSQLTGLPAISQLTFDVSWSATDDVVGSGVANYDVLVSESGGPFKLWLNSTTATTGSYTGLGGKQYRFQVYARDNAGNRQLVPSTATTNTVNQVPVIAGQSFTVNENSNAPLGAISGSDADAWQSLTYSITAGNTSNIFSVNSTTGMLSIVKPQLLDYESAPTYTLTIRATDNGLPAQFAEAQVFISLIDLPELIGNVVIGDGSAQRSLVKQVVLTFDGPITMDAGALVVTKRNAPGIISTQASQSTNGLGQTVVTLTFSGQYTRGNGALEDGYYQLAIDGTKIRRGTQSLDINGDGTGGDLRTIGSTEADKFFALFGDTDGDGLVGIAEFGQFRNVFGKSRTDLGYSELFDFDLDGTVSVNDFGQFRNRFGKSRLAF